MIDFEQVKSENNIVDVVGGLVQLKKTGKNYTGLCPFHSEKTPSFTVEESEQFFHCFGCGASGDVVSFVSQYYGVNAPEAAKMLGGKELEQVERIKRKRIIYRTPPDHTEDEAKTTDIINRCKHEKAFGEKVDKYLFNGGFLYPIVNYEGKLINARVFKNNAPTTYLTGGYSYNGFTPIITSPEKTWFSCISFNDGLKIAADNDANVAVCWSDHVIRWLSKYNFNDAPIKPMLRECDDQWLTDRMECGVIDNV